MMYQHFFFIEAFAKNWKPIWCFHFQIIIFFFYKITFNCIIVHLSHLIDHIDHIDNIDKLKYKNGQSVALELNRTFVNVRGQNILFYSYLYNIVQHITHACEAHISHEEIFVLLWMVLD